MVNFDEIEALQKIESLKAIIAKANTAGEVMTEIELLLDVVTERAVPAVKDADGNVITPAKPEKKDFPKDRGTGKKMSNGRRNNIWTDRKADADNLLV